MSVVKGMVLFLGVLKGFYKLQGMVNNKGGEVILQLMPKPENL